MIEKLTICLILIIAAILQLNIYITISKKRIRILLTSFPEIFCQNFGKKKCLQQNRNPFDFLLLSSHGLIHFFFTHIAKNSIAGAL